MKRVKWITGLCLILLAGVSLDRVQSFLNWSASSRGPSIVRKACGVLVILGALYLVYTGS